MLFVTAAAGEAAAVDVDQNGQIIPLLGSFGDENVQKQAILAVGIRLALPKLVVVEDLLEILFLVVEGAGLVGAVSILGGVIDALPVGHLGGILPPSGGGVADALVGDGPADPAGGTHNASAGCFDDVHSGPHSPKIRRALPRTIFS